MNKIAQRAGFMASVFSAVALVFFLYGTLTGGYLGPTWEGLIMVPCWIVSGISGMIYLVVTGILHLRKDK